MKAKYEELPFILKFIEIMPELAKIIAGDENNKAKFGLLRMSLVDLVDMTFRI